MILLADGDGVVVGVVRVGDVVGVVGAGRPLDLGEGLAAPGTPLACIFSRRARAAALSFSAFLRSFRALAARSSSSSRSLGGRGGSLEHMPRCLRGTDLPPRMRLPSSVIRDIRLLCRLALLRWLKSTVMALQGVGGGRAAVSAVGTEGGAEEGSPERDSSERTRAFVSRETLGVRRTVRDRRARSCGLRGWTLAASRTRRRAQPPNAREPASPDEDA